MGGTVHRGGKVKAGQKVFVYPSMGRAGRWGTRRCGSRSFRARPRRRGIARSYASKARFPSCTPIRRGSSPCRVSAGPDAVFDALGPESWEESWETTKKGVGGGDPRWVRLQQKPTLPGDEKPISTAAIMAGMARLLSKKATGLFCGCRRMRPGCFVGGVRRFITLIGSRVRMCRRGRRCLSWRGRERSRCRFGRCGIW